MTKTRQDRYKTVYLLQIQIKKGWRQHKVRYLIYIKYTLLYLSIYIEQFLLHNLCLFFYHISNIYTGRKLGLVGCLTSRHITPTLSRFAISQERVPSTRLYLNYLIVSRCTGLLFLVNLLIKGLTPVTL
jgi:hypothetical protein